MTMQRFLQLTVLAALIMMLEGCVYPPYAFYPPRYGYPSGGYYDEDRYLQPPPRRVRRPRLERPESRAGDYPPPSRGDDHPIASDERVAPLPEIERTPAPRKDAERTPAANTKGEIPVATKTANPNRVRSPYPPYTELDITGLPGGSLAKDPTTGEKFRVP